MKRSEVRESAFFLAFELMFSDDSPETVIEAAKEADTFEINGDSERLFKNVIEKSEQLDEIIARYSETRQFGRIPKVSVTILRIALYEILYDEKVPENAAISEAVILSKKFAFDSDAQFVNGILGKFSRDRQEHPHI